MSLAMVSTMVGANDDVLSALILLVRLDALGSHILRTIHSRSAISKGLR